jgi:hypothetical protein
MITGVPEGHLRRGYFRGVRDSSVEATAGAGCRGFFGGVFVEDAQDTLVFFVGNLRTLIRVV